MGLLPARLRLQLRQFSSKSNSIAESRVDGVFDLEDGTSEAAFTTDKNVLRVGPVEPVMGVRVDGGDVFVGEGENPVAGVAIAGLHLSGQEGESAPRIVGLSGDRDTQTNVERVIEAKLGTGVVLDAHQGRSKSLWTDPSYHSTVTSVIWASARM